MARQSLATDSAYVDVAVHGDGLTSLQARDESGASTHEVGINAARPARARIEKRGEYYYMWLAGAGQEPRFSGGSMRVALKAPFYVGIGVCAHDKDVVERAVFSNVALDERAGRPDARTALYSTLETVAVASTDRRVVLVERGKIESPSWNRDGLVYLSNGEWRRVAAQGGAAPEAAEPPAGGIHNAALRLPADGYENCVAIPSPDGLQTALLSYPEGSPRCPAEGEYLLRVWNAADQRMRVIARFIGGRSTLGGSPWSPDGRSLVFVSHQFVAE